MPEARRPLRSIGALVAGLVAIVILSTATDALFHSTGLFPRAGEGMSTALWLLATAYRFAFGVVGGYLTSRLAPGRPVAHAVVLGIVGVVLSTLGVVATWGRGPAFGPSWYPLALVAIALPCSWLGGRLGAARSSSPAA
jgi:hypothetical protein